MCKYRVAKKKEIIQLPECIEKFKKDVEGNELIQFTKFDDESLQLTFSLKPSKNSKWFGAVYRFSANLNEATDILPKNITAVDLIFHPNISATETNNNDFTISEVALKEDWNASFDLYKAIYNFYENFFEKEKLNLDSPLNNYAADLYKKDINEFNKAVENSLFGQTIDGVQYYKHK